MTYVYHGADYRNKSPRKEMNIVCMRNNLA